MRDEKTIKRTTNEPINIVKRIGSLRWRWNGKYESLEELTDLQLKHIIRFVDEKRGFHYNHSSEFWFNACNQLLKCRKLDNKIFGYIQKTFTYFKTNN